MSVARLVLGLAIAASMVGLAYGGKAEKEGFLGVTLEEDRAGRDAVVVAEVVRDSPASKAGVKPDDVIAKLDGKAPGKPEDFMKAIRAKKPGEIISLEITRGKEAVIIKVKLGERP